jgi:L-lactate dehydrogenase complex protein LldG
MSATAREAILGRIRDTLSGAPEMPPAPRAYRHDDPRDRGAILDELVDRLADYKAGVTRIASPDLPAAIADVCTAYGISRLVVPADCPAQWVPTGVTALNDTSALPYSALDESDGVLTGCALAIAQTGTIVLDGGVCQGRRALSLVPDRHLCVVHAEQVVGIVPEAIARLATTAMRPLTFISGPSATSDIELSRVEGVHGPRTLHVFLVD